MKIYVALSGVLVTGGCADVPMPFELDHARIMAVRVEPPTASPGDRVRVDVLVADPDAGPRLAIPRAVTSLLPVGSDAAGWYVDVPAAAPETVALLDLAVDVGGQTLTAQKTVAIGERAPNPAPPIIVQGELAVSRVSMSAGQEVAFTVESPDDELSYRWFSSVGDLSGYTRATMTLEPSAGALGHLGVVVRDQAGGTSWSIIDAEVAP